MANTEKFKFENGDILRDRVTGLEGVVMVKASYSTGCHHYGIQQQEIIAGREPDWIWLDQSRLEMVKPAAVKFEIDPNRTSGPMPSGPK